VAAREVVTLQGGAMGTSWSVKIVVKSAEESRRAVAYKARVQALIESVEAPMSTYREESELSRFNRAESTAPFPVSSETAQVVRRSLELGELTGGAFDITLGPLISLWGFDAAGRRDERPSAAELAAAKERVGLAKVRVQDTSLVKAEPLVEVNLSGIAKGYGVDVVTADLQEAGFTDVLVDLGGDVHARGTNAQGLPWRVGVNVPRSGSDPTSVLVAVHVHDAALATSGDYRNFFEQGGRRYGHIIDPRTAEPVDHELVSVSILAPDCTTADGLATAGMVLGEEETRAVLARLPGVEALFVHAAPGGGDLRVSQTPGFPLPPG
jgi:FAD:protein FMN transferase